MRYYLYLLLAALLVSSSVCATPVKKPLPNRMNQKIDILYSFMKDQYDLDLIHAQQIRTLEEKVQSLESEVSLLKTRR